MSVYIDSLCSNGWIYGPNCHLFADTKTELLEFAKSIGLKKRWKQTSRKGIEHFDLTVSKRQVALDNGAIELSRQQTVEKFNEIVKKQKYLQDIWKEISDPNNHDHDFAVKSIMDAEDERILDIVDTETKNTAIKFSI
ncbi:MAG: DUF4031 domain-containing protein [Nitrosarchaeum sp.]|nr:DUF4031 domain-containing protein [Nitrosarchaeum sp.]